MRIRRRAFLALSAAIPWLDGCRAAHASAHDARHRDTRHRDVRLGAIRWDAWYGPDPAPNSSEWFAVHNLDPPEYHARAPWFARLTPDNRLSINGTQADIDAELDYAARAGVKFWAFGWYPAGRSFRNAWTYYQNSANRTKVDWCVLIGTRSLAAAFPPVAELVEYFKQPSYERFDARPMLFVMHENTPLEPVAAALTALRSACATRGAGDPYVVLQSSVAALAASDMVAIGADATGAYAHVPGNPSAIRPYAALAAGTEAFDAALTATGHPAVPLIMTGWDRRPRIDHPPPFDPSRATGYIEPGTPAQIAAHAAAVVALVKSNPAAYPAQRALIYSWNECDEGGSPLIPTWTPGGPNTAILDALAAVMD